MLIVVNFKLYQGRKLSLECFNSNVDGLFYSLSSMIVVEFIVSDWKGRLLFAKAHRKILHLLLKLKLKWFLSTLGNVQ